MFDCSVYLPIDISFTIRLTSDVRFVCLFQDRTTDLLVLKWNVLGLDENTQNIEFLIQ